MERNDVELGVLDAGIVDAAVAELSALIHHQRRSAAHDWNKPDLSMTNLHVLMVIDAEGTVPMSQLAEMMLCSMPNASGIVDRMEERGLIERLRDDHDRRVVLVRPTDAGRKALGEFESVRQNNVRRILETMPIEDQRICLRAFRCMRQAAEQMERAQET